MTGNAENGKTLVDHPDVAASPSQVEDGSQVLKSRGRGAKCNASGRIIRWSSPMPTSMPPPTHLLMPL